MHVVALDTTTREGSVALVDETHVIDERRGDSSRPHAERLPGDIVDLVGSHHLQLAEIDLFAVASGPGSFTGLRIGIATVQGLALATGRSIVAVSALDALAHVAAADLPDGSTVSAWVDARRGEVFSATYRIHRAAPYTVDRLTIVDGPMVARPEVALEQMARALNRPMDRFIGDGAVLYSAAIRERAPGVSIVPGGLLAGIIGLMAVDAARRGTAIHPAAVQPLYVRRPDAELARDAAR